jgi:hypothetical protein
MLPCTFQIVKLWRAVTELSRSTTKQENKTLIGPLRIMFPSCALEYRTCDWHLSQDWDAGKAIHQKKMLLLSTFNEFTVQESKHALILH